MPTLLIHHSDQVHGVVLRGRVLIGRVPPAGIVVPDPAVSRIHAWIDRVDDRYYVADAGSRDGTIVDEFPIAARHTLMDGDEVRIGPAVLTYRDQDELPAGVTEMAIAQSNGATLAAAGGVLFACGCGAPLWAPLDWVGRRGRCTVCGRRTPVPALGSCDPRAVLPPVSAAAVATVAVSPVAVAPVVVPRAAAPRAAARAHTERHCSICQWAIGPTDEQTACPTCGLTFHSECWQENKGCSAYGCASVDALAEPVVETTADSGPMIVEVTHEEPHERFPIEFAMLGGSVACSLLSLVAFGVPSALLAVCTTAYWLAHRRRGESLRNGIVAVAMAMCLTGICAGLWFSAFRWLHRPLAAPWQSVS